MNSIAKVQSLTKYPHSPQISTRRRSLFPTSETDSEDSDLGPMSPIVYDPIPEIEKGLAIGDYHILGIMETSDEVYTPNNQKISSYSEPMSPLILSPSCSKPIKLAAESTLDDVRSRASPSSTLKTPHDTSTFKTKLPKLTRKSLDLTDSLIKRKLSPTSPELSKQMKLDSSSKVRTTLFPDTDLALPTNIFYSGTKDIMDEIRNKKKTLQQPIIGSSYKRKSTQPTKKEVVLNAGIRHKIRPKKKKFMKKPSRGTMNEIEKRAINNYLKDLRNLKTNTSQNNIKVTLDKENVPVMQPVKQIIMPPKLQRFDANSSSLHTENVVSKKRSLSPTLDEPNPNKKFFKSSRTTKGVVTMNENIKVQVDHRKISLLNKSPECSFNFDSDESEMQKTNIDNIISSLDNDIRLENSNNRIVLQAYNSIVASDNSIILHQEPSRNTNLILSPISQMCDFTSGLALSSPKRAKNLTSVLDQMSSDSNTPNVFNDTSEKKVFPIFSNPSSGIITKKETKVSATTDKKFKKISEDQMLLDAGQKKFGVTQCMECQFVYHIGDPSDENMHISYHEAAHTLRFNGWKSERIVAVFHNRGRVIKIVPGDSKLWWKRAVDLMELINRDLGCYEMEFKLEECQVFLYIKNRTIVGCLVAVAKSVGHRMLSTCDHQADVCSEEKYPVKCGISRIWVSLNHRKQGIATALLDTVKKNFVYGSVLSNSDIALSVPTEMGKQFAKKYFNTSNYLVYFM